MIERQGRAGVREIPRDPRISAVVLTTFMRGSLWFAASKIYSMIGLQCGQYVHPSVVEGGDQTWTGSDFGRPLSLRSSGQYLCETASCIKALTHQVLLQEKLISLAFSPQNDTRSQTLCCLCFNCYTPSRHVQAQLSPLNPTIATRSRRPRPPL